MGKKNTTLVIFMRSGNAFEVEVETWHLKRAGGEVRELTWRSPEGKGQKLKHIDLERVEAVLEKT